MDVTRPDASGRSRLAPWMALIAAVTAEGLHHQVLSDMLRFDCRLGDARLFVLAGVAAIAWMAVGAWISWVSVRHDDAMEGRQGGRRFIAVLGMLMGLLLSVAVAWQTFAGWVVPACAP